MDVAKCVEAHIRNITATFGARLYEEQVAKLKVLGIKHALLFYDRDKAGFEGSTEAVELLATHDISATIFNWSQHFKTTAGVARPIPEDITDPCEFSVAQLKWLRAKRVI